MVLICRVLLFFIFCSSWWYCRMVMVGMSLCSVILMIEERIRDSYFKYVFLLVRKKVRIVYKKCLGLNDLFILEYVDVFVCRKDWLKSSWLYYVIKIERKLYFLSVCWLNFVYFWRYRYGYSVVFISIV